MNITYCSLVDLCKTKQLESCFDSNKLKRKTSDLFVGKQMNTEFEGKLSTFIFICSSQQDTHKDTRMFQFPPSAVYPEF